MISNPTKSPRTAALYAEELERDAVRYRWLRADTASELGEPWCVTRDAITDFMPRALNGNEIDDAIDAAIASQKEADRG